MGPSGVNQGGVSVSTAGQGGGYPQLKSFVATLLHQTISLGSYDLEVGYIPPFVFTKFNLPWHLPQSQPFQDVLP